MGVGENGWGVRGGGGVLYCNPLKAESSGYWLQNNHVLQGPSIFQRKLLSYNT